MQMVYNSVQKCFSSDAHTDSANGKHIFITGLHTCSKDLSNMFLVKNLSNTNNSISQNVVFYTSFHGDALRFQNLQECGWSEFSSPTLSPFPFQKRLWLSNFKFALWWKIHSFFTLYLWQLFEAHLYWLLNKPAGTKT